MSYSQVQSNKTTARQCTEFKPAHHTATFTEARMSARDKRLGQKGYADFTLVPLTESFSKARTTNQSARDEWLNQQGYADFTLVPFD